MESIDTKMTAYARNQVLVHFDFGTCGHGITCMRVIMVPPRGALSDTAIRPSACLSHGTAALGAQLP